MGLDSVELIIEVEHKFNIHISNIEAENIYTVKDIFDLILQKKDSQGNEGEFYSLLKKIIADKSGLPPSKISLNSNITYDLGLD